MVSSRRIVFIHAFIKLISLPVFYALLACILDCFRFKGVETKYMIAQDLREGCYSEDIFPLLRERGERRCGAEKAG